jgi:hypothetical protein
MNTFSSDNSRILPTGITSQITQSVNPNPLIKVPTNNKDLNKKELKEINNFLNKFLEILSNYKS